MAEIERRRTPRFYLVSRVDVLVAGSGDPLWGAIANISRAGTTLYIRQCLKLQSKATLRFRFQGEGGRELIEEVTATLVWQRGDTAGRGGEGAVVCGRRPRHTAPQLRRAGGQEGGA